MKAIAIALAVLALAATAGLAEQWIDTDLEDLIENAPDKEDYPDASAVFLKMQESADISDDGSVVMTRNKLIKVLTLRGRERHSNQSFLFNTEQSVLSLVKGLTTRKTGRKVEVEDDAINVVTPAFLEGASMYTNVMEKVFSFPVAGPGSTLELQLREDHEPAPDGSYSGIEFMGAIDPILDASFTIGFPPGDEPPQAVGYPGELGTTSVEKNEGRGKITWSVTDVPALVEEEHMPPATKIFPSVIYSSYTDWGEPADFFAGEFFPHIETEGSIASHVAELTDGLMSSLEKERAIFLDVATGVRNVHLRLGLGGYEPNDASQVLGNKYGDTRDKAVLLISMLRAAGLDAFPALVAGVPDAAFTESVPTLKQFTRILVALPDGDTYRFLDPFLDDAPYGFVRWGRGNTALVVSDDGSGELAKVPGFEASESLAVRRMEVALDADGSADVVASCDLTGYFDRRARIDLKDATPSEKDKLFDAAANLVSSGATSAGYSLSDVTDLTEPVRVTHEIAAEDLAVPQGDMMIVHLPPYPHEFASSGVYPSLAERKYAFEFPCELTSELEITIELPDGYEVAWLPDDFEIKSPVADFALSCESVAERHAVVWRRSVTVSERSVSVDGYDAFKDSYDTLISPKNRLILLKKA